MFSEQTAEEFVSRRAAAACAAGRRDMLALAADRTRRAAEQMIERDHARQRNAMRPYVLATGALVHVSFLHAPTVRRIVKSSFNTVMSRNYSEETYRIARVALAPRSRRVFLYDAVAVDTALIDGQQQPTQIANVRIRLPLHLTDIDRRYLQPITEPNAAPRLGHEYPNDALSLRLTRRAAPGYDDAEADSDVGDDAY